MSQTESLLDVYLYENVQLLEQLDGLLLAADKLEKFSDDQVGSIFRILHTIKGSSAMMDFDKLAKLSHAMEDVFGFIRDNKGTEYDHRKVCDMVFLAGDYLRLEFDKLQGGADADGDPGALLSDIQEYFKLLKGNPAGNPVDDDAPVTEVAQASPTTQAAVAQVAPAPAKNSNLLSFYIAVIRFSPDCKMEAMRAFGIQKSIEPLCKRVLTNPKELTGESADDFIVNNGFTMYIESSSDEDTLRAKIQGNLLIKSFTLEPLPDISNTPLDRRVRPEEGAAVADAASAPQIQKYSYMSVRLDKLDKLLDLVGEIVIAESTVSKNPDVIGLQMENFSKATRQLRKLTDELQDTVMSIRMIPIDATFRKLERIVRDVGKKTGKQADIVISGEDTEMDKNVIDNLSDPLMHIVRNSMDHGIEEPEYRRAAGKKPTGTISIEAKSTGGDVLITISDDGRGLNRNALIAKGLDKGLIKKAPEEMTDKDVYSLIFAPGFSTKEAVTEFSGRGVGMDVVTKNIQKINGSISVDSEFGKGMTVTLRIPLTLAIIDGMQVAVGQNIFIVPLLNIRESFKPKANDVFHDPSGNNMIMIRNECYSVVRLYEILGIETSVKNYEDGILMLMDSDNGSYCLLVDRLIGEQQTVIKPMPLYISRYENWLRGIAGCTILGNGNISLILDINTLA